MNSSNLINPLTPFEHRSWNRWLITTAFLIVLSVLVLLGITMHNYFKTYCLQKEVTNLQKSCNLDVIQKHAALSKEHQEIEQKIKKIKQWKKSFCYQNYVKALAETIPAQVALSSVDFLENNVLIQGQTQTLEVLLGFLHALDQTTLFQSMNLIELQPSEIMYKEKKLVNFVIKGHLIK
jgi:Tfp pilus assembly protein PilN